MGTASIHGGKQKVSDNLIKRLSIFNMTQNGHRASELNVIFDRTLDEF
jgi:hypothetical protein